MDIRLRKPKVIKLKKEKIKQSPTPIKIHIDSSITSEPIKKSWEGGEFPCIQCGAKEAIELGRCSSCDIEHQKLIARLNIGPKRVIKKVPLKLTYRKEVSRGVVVTISTTKPLRM